ncbi:MAG: DNA-binding response regulator [Elusimicrobia bacterium]|nr:MAG: DNA-binding response regulator [Elusimicrobiota bacterium]KAF0157879.1 MAG: DNA-binding response regulator [Elusimicrobiota bacterium]
MKKQLERILVVDDEAGMCRLITTVLAEEGYSVTATQKPQDGVAAVRKGGFDLVITDLRMPRMSGIEILQAIKAAAPSLPVILITAYSSVDSAVQAMKLGAADYVAKPFKNDELIAAVEGVLEKSRLRAENRRLREELDEKYSFSSIVGQSAKMRSVFGLIVRIAKADVTAMIEGESGTGKELAARAIHFSGPRRDKPFVAIHCGGLPETMLESELFGHVKGAFTDAVKDRRGLLESADGGTVFLDEVGDMPQSLQVKLLRFIQEREIRRVGSDETSSVDVHLIAATNRVLQVEVKEGRFRGDLYYRLAVVPVRMPPLRERPEDIPLLARHFVRKHAADKERGLEIAPEAMQAIAGYHWPGNVRELENAIQHAIAFAGSGALIGRDMLPAQVLGGAGAPQAAAADRAFRDAKRETVEAFEKAYLSDLIKRSSGNVTRAAQAAGMDRKNLQELLRKYGFTASDYSGERA